MIKAIVVSVFLLTAQNLCADPGTSHIIKAKLVFQGKEHVGYFKVWGYLYLTKDSLSYRVSKFTVRAKSWVYGDTIAVCSEIFFLKDLDLTILPADKTIKMNKNAIKQIYPLDLIEHNRWKQSYTSLQSIDKQWVLSRVHSEKEMIIELDGLCTYSVLFFNKPDSISTNLVKDLESEIKKEFKTGKSNSAAINPLIEKLRKLKVLIVTHCSPT